MIVNHDTESLVSTSEPHIFVTFVTFVICCNAYGAPPKALIACTRFHMLAQLEKGW